MSSNGDEIVVWCSVMKIVPTRETDFVICDDLVAPFQGESETKTVSRDKKFSINVFQG